MDVIRQLPEAVAADREASAKTARFEVLKKKIVLYFDGQLNQIDSIISLSEEFCEDEKLLCVKLAAALTMVTQPNDVMKMFMLLHGWLSLAEFEHFDCDSYASKPKYMPKIDAMLAGFTPARRHIYRKYFMTLPHQISTCITPSIVQTGWRVPGIWPPKPLMFMALWPGWKCITPQQQVYVLDCAYLIAVQMIGGNAEGFDGKAIKGTMCDDFAEKLLAPIFGPITRGVDNAPVNGQSQITDLTLSRWRFTIFNSEIRAELLRRLEHERQEVDRKEAASLERQEKKAEGERAKKAKADHLASPEGQRDAEVAAKKKEERVTNAAAGKAFRLMYPGKQYRRRYH